MTQGLSPRGEVRRKRRANVRVDGQEPGTRRERRTSGRLTAKSISIKDAKRRPDDRARKATELTPGDLLCVASATESAARQSDRRAEVESHGHAATADGFTRPPFAHPECLPEMRDSFPLARGRHHFFPKRSFNAALSSMASASNRLSRVFSSSSVFSRLASETSIPPNFAFHL
jgi:hypothetical protein